MPARLTNSHDSITAFAIEISITRQAVDGINLQNIIEGGEVFEELIDNPNWLKHAALRRRIRRPVHCRMLSQRAGAGRRALPAFRRLEAAAAHAVSLS
jgi:hypothetical protein